MERPESKRRWWRLTAIFSEEGVEHTTSRRTDHEETSICIEGSATIDCETVPIGAEGRARRRGIAYRPVAARAKDANDGLEVL